MTEKHDKHGNSYLATMIIYVLNIES